MSDEKIDALAVMDVLGDEAARVLLTTDDREHYAAWQDQVRKVRLARDAVAEIIEAAAELKEVCNRPSAARTRAESWRRLDRALARVRSS